MVSQRHAVANNPYMSEYNPEISTSYLMYLDANNLYGWAMCQPLPVSNFAWVKPADKLLDDILQLPDNSDTGYILEVDLAYPSELHADHNDYPLAPERLAVKHEMLSPYQLDLIDKLRSSGLNVAKLTPNLQDKTRYILHYRNLQLYAELGLQVTKCHRILRFMQSPWMKPYIEKNTLLRKQATSDFEKRLL